jgi:hypothetical protein
VICPRSRVLAFARRTSRKLSGRWRTANPCFSSRPWEYAETTASADVMAVTKWSIGRNKQRPYAISLNESALSMENVEQVMQLISATAGARENDETPSAAL